MIRSDSSLYLHQAAAFNILDQAQLDEERLDDAKRGVEAMLAFADAFLVKRDSIKTDPDLTRDGMRRRMETEAVKANESIQASATRRIGAVDERIAELTAQMGAGLVSSIDGARAVLMVERRAAAAAIDPLLLPQKYLALCASAADDLTCEAIEQAPALALLVDASTIAEGRATRAARQHPVLADELRQLREVREMLTMTRRLVERELHEFLPVDDLAGVVFNA